MPCESSSCINALQSLIDRFRARRTVPTEAERRVLDRVAALLDVERRSSAQCVLVTSCVRRSGPPQVPPVPGQEPRGVRESDGDAARP